MNSFIRSLSYFMVALLSLTACGGRGATSSLPDDADTIPLHYASNLTLVKTPEYIMATLRNPWDTTKILHTYLLVPKEKPLPKQLPTGTVLRTPITKATVYSSVHCSLLMQLGAGEQIAGVCDLNYIKLPYIHQRCRSGEIIDLGEGLNPDVEKIIDLHPDLIMLSPFENSGGYGRVEKLNIPIMECADYMETSPLARAEWMRFYGLVFGREEHADSLFAEVEHAYLSLCRLTDTLANRPVVITGTKSGSAWYVPGGNSTYGHLYADAGMAYPFADRKSSGSIPLSFETVYEQAHNADLWLIRYNSAADKTYKELRREYASYARFKAFLNKQVYGCNTNEISYYEETTFHPDWLLQDLIILSQPQLLPGKTLRYYKPLAEE